MFILSGNRLPKYQHHLVISFHSMSGVIHGIELVFFKKSYFPPGIAMLDKWSAWVGIIGFVGSILAFRWRQLLCGYWWHSASVSCYSANDGSMFNQRLNRCLPNRMASVGPTCCQLPHLFIHFPLSKKKKQTPCPNQICNWSNFWCIQGVWEKCYFKCMMDIVLCWEGSWKMYFAVKLLLHTRIQIFFGNLRFCTTYCPEILLNIWTSTYSALSNISYA